MSLNILYFNYCYIRLGLPLSFVYTSGGGLSGAWGPGKGRSLNSRHHLRISLQPTNSLSFSKRWHGSPYNKFPSNTGSYHSPHLHYRPHWETFFYQSRSWSTPIPAPATLWRKIFDHKTRTIPNRNPQSRERSIRINFIESSSRINFAEPPSYWSRRRFNVHGLILWEIMTDRHAFIKRSIILGNDMIEEFNFMFEKMHLLRYRIMSTSLRILKICLTWCSSSECVLLKIRISSKVNNNVFINKWCENLIHASLKSGRCIRKIKWHNIPLILTIAHKKCCIWFGSKRLIFILGWGYQT